MSSPGLLSLPSPPLNLQVHFLLDWLSFNAILYDVCPALQPQTWFDDDWLLQCTLVHKQNLDVCKQLILPLRLPSEVFSAWNALSCDSCPLTHDAPGG